MPEIPKKNDIIEKYKNLSCNIRPSFKDIIVTIKNNIDNDLSDLLIILRKYENATIEIRNIRTLSELNKICSLLSNFSYDGNVVINLVHSFDCNRFISGLSNNKYINLEVLPCYAKIKGFYLENRQSDFISWTHNLNDNDKNTLVRCLTVQDKRLFLEQERVIKSFYSELIKKYPNIMSLDMKRRFEIIFWYVKDNFRYFSECLNADSEDVRPDAYYTKDAVETYKRRGGVCVGRSNLLTLVTNNNLLRCNCASIDGYTESSRSHPNGIAHCWNVFIDNDGNAYHYDLSFRNFVQIEIHDIGTRRISNVYNSNVHEAISRPPLPPRREADSQLISNVKILKPLPPRREKK